MRRDKEFWRKLNSEERAVLVYLERADKRLSGQSNFLPAGASECSACGTPSLISGLCPACDNQLEQLIKKGGGENEPIS